jgi:hypothetical protein
VTIVVPATAAATFSLASVHGTITSNLEGSPASFERGQRHRFDVNGGGALVEAETFGGRIQIMRKGTEGAAPRPRQGGDEDGGRKGPRDGGYALGVGPSVSIAVGEAVALVQPQVAVAVETALAAVRPDIDFALETALDVASLGRYGLRGAAGAATIRR